MTSPPREPTTTPPPTRLEAPPSIDDDDLRDPRFVQSLTGKLAAGGFSRSAWRVFWARAWRRAWLGVRDQPARRRGFVGWAALALALGVGTIAAAYGPGDPRGEALGVAITFGAWYAVTTFWALIHLGRIRTWAGEPYDAFLLPNGLSYVRFALSPLIVKPILSLPSGAAAAPFLVLLLGLLVASDLVDGMIARLRGQTTPFGKVLDPLADLAFLTCLALGLHRVGVIPTVLLVLIIVRYPGALVGAIVLFLRRGPQQVDATIIGKATTAAISGLCLLGAALYLLAPAWLGGIAHRVAVIALSILVAANIVYLVYRGVTYGRPLARHLQS